MIPAIFSFFSTLLAFTASVAYAGSVSSGGGALYRYANNPWWIENTETVSYCIELNKEAFDLGDDGAAQMVRDVLQEWKAAFDMTREEPYYEDGELGPYPQLNIATQKFVQAPCSPTTELRFQFGILHDDQRKYFDKVNDFVGAAVQTAYDLETLKSTGFVYIAPLSGPLKPNAEFLSPDAFSKQVCDNCLLKLVMLHETGHIFGLKHSDNEDSVLHERIPEWMVDELYVDQVKQGKFTKENLAQHFAAKRNLMSYLPERNIEGCDDYSPTMHNEFFAIPEDYQCVRFSFHKDRMKVYAKKSAKDEYKYFGYALVGNNSTGSHAMINLDLPKEQKVFTKLPEDRLDRRTLFGATFEYEAAGQAFYFSEDKSVQNDMYIRYKPLGEIEAIGLGKRVINDLFSPGYMD